MDVWSKGTVKSLALPGGLLFLAAVAVLQGGWLTLPAPAVDFYYYAVFGAGLLLAWRFHSSRVLLALLVLLLAERAVGFFSAGHAPAAGPGRIAWEAIALLLPANFLILALLREPGLTVPVLAPRFLLLFVQSVFVAVICRPGQVAGPGFLTSSLFSPRLFPWTRIPQLAVLAFFAVGMVLLIRFLLYRKPVESGFFWALLASFLALQAGGVGPIASAYVATAGLVLVSSIIETSYLMAYHDELTSLPARRAFNEAVLTLENPYAVAIVDIDHFKRFNDTYGHETGDEVLRMVASRLARVSGGGQAFRCGGEEFAILFPGKPLREAAEHLELLRAAIERSAFRRRGLERRTVPRGPDRRKTAGRASKRNGRTLRELAAPDSAGLSVTVSIGVAEPSVRMRDVAQVIEAADKALYRAKQAGRNRVETATTSRTRASRFKRSIA